MSALSIQVPFPVFQDRDGQPLENGYVWIGVANLNPQTNPVVAYFDAALTIPAPQPLRTLNGYISRAGTPAQIYVDGVNFSILVQDSKGSMVYNFPDGTGISPDASGVVYNPPYTGSTPTNVQTKLAESLNAVDDFGADNTGATNTTTELLAFYTACIDTGRPGHIPTGTYLVTPGVLKFYSGGVNKLWPNITTDGHYAVFFDVDGTGNINAPIIEITTVLANSANHPAILSQYWQGGSHGGLTFRDTTGQTADQRHGFSLTGLWFTNFGVISGLGLRGSTIYQPQNMIGGTNPDPWSCATLSFDAIFGENNAGRTVTSENGVGLDSWFIKLVGCINNASGGWYGAGTGTVIEQISGAGVDGGLGWFYDDGADSGSPFGGNRITIGVVECDGWQQGFRINKLTDFNFTQFRFNHRYSAAAGKYWPERCFEITAGADPSIRTGYINAFNRIESGGTLADLGNFMQCNNSSSIAGLVVNVDYADNGGLGVTDAWITQNSQMSTAMSIRVSRLTKVLWDSFNKGLSDALGSAAATLVPNTGWGTSAAKLTFNAAQVAASLSTQYDLATSTYTAPYTGLYQVQVNLPLTCAIGTRIRTGFYTTVQGTQCAKAEYQVNAGVQTYSNVGQVYLNQGDTVFVVADQNTAAATLAATGLLNADETRFVVIPL